MLHEDVQADILGVEVSGFNRAVALAERGRVDSYLELALVRVTRCADEEPRHREALLHDVLGVFNWRLKQLFEVSVIRVFVVARLLPVCNRLTFPDSNVEERVEKKHDFILHAVDV